MVRNKGKNFGWGMEVAVSLYVPLGLCCSFVLALYPCSSVEQIFKYLALTVVLYSSQKFQIRV